jgi:hypothetical protein
MISAIKPLSKKMVLGAPPDFVTRPSIVSNIGAVSNGLRCG